MIQPSACPSQTIRLSLDNGQLIAKRMAVEEFDEAISKPEHFFISRISG